MKTVSVVIPCYNEEGNVEPLVQELDKLVLLNADLNFQVLIVDNASVDSTQSLVMDLRTVRPWLGFITLARNCGTEGAMLAGLDHIDGDCVVFLNADLEDPPELISTFLQHWKDGLIKINVINMF